MLTPQQILEIADTMQPLLDELNQFITKDMLRRLMARLGRGEGFLLTGSDQWQMEVYKAAGGHFEAVQQEIQRFTKKSDAEVQAIFEDAGITAWAADDAFYAAHGKKSIPLLQSETMRRILEDTYRRTNGEIHNLTRTTAVQSQKQFIKLLDTAHFKVITGAQSYTAAVREAVEDAAKTQATVLYPSGKTDSVETAVLRAVRTGAAQASGNMSLQGMAEHDWDLIRVSAHLGARYGDGGENPSNHFWWQGKLYSRTGKSKTYPDFLKTTAYGTGEGLSGWNCRHSFGPGDPQYNPFQDFDAEENKRVYDLSQKQRRAEANSRRSKREVLGLQKAIQNTKDDAVRGVLQEDYNRAAARLTRQNAYYRQFCKENNLKQLSDRVHIAKWTRSEAVRAAKANEKILTHTIKSSKIKLNTNGVEKHKTSVETEVNSSVGSALFSDEAKRELRIKEQEISGNRFETAVVYGLKGNILFEKKGNKDGVSFTDNEFKQMRGCILTHNHPNDSIFSIADINIMRKTNLAELRACTHNGTHILRINVKWDKELSSFKNIEHAYYKISDAIGMKYRDIAAQNGKHILHYIDDIEKETFMEFCKKYALQYSWEERK